MLTLDRSRGEEGVTLVELLVVLVLMGVVGGVVVSAIVSSMHSSRAASARTAAIHELEVSLERVGRELRAADPLYISDDGEYHQQLGAEFLRDRTIHVVNYLVETGDDGEQRLVQDLTTFDLDELVDDPDAAPVQAPRRTLITTLDNDGEPVFRYYDRDGDELHCDPDDEGESVCRARFGSAHKVGIRFIREIPGHGDVRAETRLSVRNTRYRSTD